MTYCVGMVLDKGLVLMSDTRTNSGVDNISTFRKLFQWSVPGERMIAVMTAGNLATTQAVISQLDERTKTPSERDNTLLKGPTMFQVATEIGRLLRNTVEGVADDSGSGVRRAEGGGAGVGAFWPCHGAGADSWRRRAALSPRYSSGSSTFSCAEVRASRLKPWNTKPR